MEEVRVREAAMPMGSALAALLRAPSSVPSPMPAPLRTAAGVFTRAMAAGEGDGEMWAMLCAKFGESSSKAVRAVAVLVRVDTCAVLASLGRVLRAASKEAKLTMARLLRKTLDKLHASAQGVVVTHAQGLIEEVAATGAEPCVSWLGGAAGERDAAAALAQLLAEEMQGNEVAGSATQLTTALADASVLLLHACTAMRGVAPACVWRAMERVVCVLARWHGGTSPLLSRCLEHVASTVALLAAADAHAAEPLVHAVDRGDVLADAERAEHMARVAVAVAQLWQGVLPLVLYRGGKRYGVVHPAATVVHDVVSTLGSIAGEETYAHVVTACFALGRVEQPRGGEWISSSDALSLVAAFLPLANDAGALFHSLVSDVTGRMCAHLSEQQIATLMPAMFTMLTGEHPVPVAVSRLVAHVCVLHPQYLAQLFARLDAASADERHNALDVVAVVCEERQWTHAPHVQVRLLESLLPRLYDNQLVLRAHVSQLLAMFDAQELFPRLLPLLVHEDGRVRSATERAVATVLARRAAAVDALLDSLDTLDGDARDTAQVDATSTPDEVGVGARGEDDAKEGDAGASRLFERVVYLFPAWCRHASDPRELIHALVAKVFAAPQDSRLIQLLRASCHVLASHVDFVLQLVHQRLDKHMRWMRVYAKPAGASTAASEDVLFSQLSPLLVLRVVPPAKLLQHSALHGAVCAQLWAMATDRRIHAQVRMLAADVYAAFDVSAAVLDRLCERVDAEPWEWKALNLAVLTALHSVVHHGVFAGGHGVDRVLQRVARIFARRPLREDEARGLHELQRGTMELLGALIVRSVTPPDHSASQEPPAEVTTLDAAASQQAEGTASGSGAPLLGGGSGEDEKPSSGITLLGGGSGEDEKPSSGITLLGGGSGEDEKPSSGITLLGGGSGEDEKPSSGITLLGEGGEDEKPSSGITLLGEGGEGENPSSGISILSSTSTADAFSRAGGITILEQPPLSATTTTTTTTTAPTSMSTASAIIPHVLERIRGDAPIPVRLCFVNALLCAVKMQQQNGASPALAAALLPSVLDTAAHATVPDAVRAGCLRVCFLLLFRSAATAPPHRVLDVAHVCLETIKHGGAGAKLEGIKLLGAVLGGVGDDAPLWHEHTVLLGQIRTALQSVATMDESEETRQLAAQMAALVFAAEQ